ARPGLLSFRLPSGEPVIEARTRSARSLARNAAAAMTSVMCRCHAGQERASRSEERRVGKSVPCCVDLGGRRIIKKKKKKVWEEMVGGGVSIALLFVEVEG